MLGFGKLSVFLLFFLAVALATGGGQRLAAEEPSELEMTAYADASNFQTNGAIPQAVDAWKAFLARYPRSSLASGAAHYLGVCYMQQAEPDYPAAIVAFQQAVEDQASPLREESLVNLGWCQFASAGEGENRDAPRLQAALDAFKTLIREKPGSKYVDRALFYGGEAAYALGNSSEAVALYDRLLEMESSKDSPLRCDTLFARGIALEAAQRLSDAVAAYQQVLESCGDGELAVTAKIRLGDAAIAQKQFPKAIDWFSQVIADAPENTPYALFRQAFACVQSNQPAEAAALYERLSTEFPDSPYTAVAQLASAQTIYRTGDLEEAGKRFKRVLDHGQPEAATEAAHWLATIALRQNQIQAAIEVAKQQIADGAVGPFAVTLQMDLAEATMLLPGQTEAAQQLFRQLYTGHPQSVEAPRALYNAAFAALQLGQHAQAGQWAAEFLEKYPSHPLAADVSYLAAESQLMSGNAQAAAAAYRKLIDAPATAEKIQYPLWVMRTATALSLAGEGQQAIELLNERRDSFNPLQRAEADLMIGSFQMAAGDYPAAITAYQRCSGSDVAWPRADEALLQLGQAHLLGGDEAAAAQQWESLIQRFPASFRSDHARYRLAQAAARAGEHAAAVKRFDELLASGLDPSLKPLTLYGRAWNLMRGDQPTPALQTLDQLASEFPDHNLATETKLARGMCLRALDKPTEAKQQLEDFLSQDPQGINRGHALYELALIDQQAQSADAAAARLQQLITEVPDYPNLGKVIYELAWSLKEGGNDDGAERRFKELIDRDPGSSLAAEAHYFVGQRLYSQEKWDLASEQYRRALDQADNDELAERAIYRLGWALYRAGKYQESSAEFAKQVERFPSGKFLPDALLMVGEGFFKLNRFEESLKAFTVARDRMRANNESAEKLTERADRQVRELALLHGGQSLSQLKRWPEAQQWYQELQTRFPQSSYLPQAAYETAYALQQVGKDDDALKQYESIAAAQSNEIGARARFMMGEIHFGRNRFAEAIPEFQLVISGYGGDDATAAIKNWQAKSGYEAGRCSELMMQQVRNSDQRATAGATAAEFFRYVLEKHPQHELAPKAQERLVVLQRLGFAAPAQP